MLFQRWHRLFQSESGSVQCVAPMGQKITTDKPANAVGEDEVKGE